MNTLCFSYTLKLDMYPRAEHFSNSAQHAEGMPFIQWRFKTAYLLLFPTAAQVPSVTGLIFCAVRPVAGLSPMLHRLSQSALQNHHPVTALQDIYQNWFFV